MVINIPISWGELVDKITILEIKLDRIQDAKKLENIDRELQALLLIFNKNCKEPEAISQVKAALRAVNESLWQIEDDIRKDFTFKKKIQDECKEIVEEVFDQNPIALHIRRGDFLINSGNHHNLSLDWYEKALKKFDPDREVIIFSDDIFWASAQELFKPDRFIISDGNSSYHDMFMMTQCSDFIIANSTFSWWGAWLANTGRVIAPSKWFGPNNSHLNTKDLYPDHWEIL